MTDVESAYAQRVRSLTDDQLVEHLVKSQEVLDGGPQRDAARILQQQINPTGEVEEHVIDLIARKMLAVLAEEMKRRIGRPN